MNKKIFIIGIVTCVLYFVAVAGFMVFKTEVALTIWELLTVLSAPVVMIVLYKLQNTTYICAILCQIGFWGAMFINENLWYLAPWGYGLGFMILCIQALKISNSKN